MSKDADMKAKKQTNKTISVIGNDNYVETKETNLMMNSNINETRTKATKTNISTSCENVNYENNLSIYSRDINEYSVLSKEEEYELGLKILNGDKSAEMTLVVHNLRLGFSVAKKYASTYKLDINDLIQQANIGLIMAAAKFDCRKAKFSTIAVRYCKAYISKYVKKYVTAFSISEHDNEDLSRIRTIRKEYIDTYEEEPSVEKVVEIFNATIKNAKKRLSIEKADALLCAIYTKSIESTIGEDGCTVEDLVADKSIDLHAEAENNFRTRLWQKAISRLDTRKAAIVRLHMGFDCDEQSYSEIGTKLKLTGERVRQLFEEACREIADGPYSEELRAMAS